MMSSFPRPADFVASNYCASLDKATCNGCGKCMKRCQMNAFTMENKKAVLDTGKCIGCGLCISTCKTGSLKLIKNEIETVPPENMEKKFEIIMDGKKGTAGKLLSATRGAFGLRP